MGFSNDNDHCGELCSVINATEDSICEDDGSCSPPPKTKEGLKRSVTQSRASFNKDDDDDTLSSRRANDAKQVSCTGSGRDEENKSASCGLDAMDTSDQGVEAVDSQTAPTHNLSSSFNIKGHDHDEKVIESDVASERHEMHEPLLQTSALDDADESDIEEEDVKVCDICGDAGREDLLAVCSRCSDGAEHTYCMRVMLDKVPESDWLCEECKLSDELEARKRDQSRTSGSCERSKSFGRTSSLNRDRSFKLDKKDSFCERNKIKNVCLNKQVSSKRSGDIIESGIAAKRPALESNKGSPTTSNPGRTTVLPRDNSTKNSDKIKEKPTNQISTGTESTGDSSENARSPTATSLHSPRGNFMKSNSFSSGNSKLNVKVSDEVLQKEKQGTDAKDGPGRLIDKSMSFKGLGRSSVSEPKVKMISPKCAPVQELKGQKQGRERNSFERKNTIKLDHSFAGQMASTSSKRPNRGDNISSSSVIHSRDSKNAQSDGKITTLSKHACHSVNKLSDATSSIGEVKRLSSTGFSGSVAVNGKSIIAEAKHVAVSLKEGPVLNSPRTADRLSAGSNGGKEDILDNQSERTLENPVGRSRLGVNAGLVGASRRTKEGLNEDNKLKAAIEAAMQKKQHIFKKNRISEKPSELSTLDTQVNHVGDPNSNPSISEEVMHERDAALNPSSNASKLTSLSSAKLLKVYPADCVTSLIGESVLTVSAIPEHESVWQGGFEIHRSGKIPDMCAGFQAHVSSFASEKVLKVVKKFPQKIVLDEVPRPCAWPVQFKEIGAREDNIALYFFAKDVESYVRSYKILLDYLMKHDLALRGNINGVELLVFPSTHLPNKAQCWNTLFFMWGVFRGKRPFCPENRSASLERPDGLDSNLVPLDKNVASAACPENSCVLRPEVEDLAVSGSGHQVISGCEARASVGSSFPHSSSLSNGDCHNQRCSAGNTCLSSQTSTECSKERPNNHSADLGPRAWAESGTAALKGHRYQGHNTLIEYQQSTPDVDRGGHLHETEKSPSYLMQDKQDILCHSSQVPLLNEQVGEAVVSSVEQQVIETVNKNLDEVKFENSFKQEKGRMDDKDNRVGNLKLEDRLKQEEETEFLLKKNAGILKLEDSLKQEVLVDINVSAANNMEEIHSMQFSPKRHSCVDPSESISRAASVVPQQRPWMNVEGPSEAGDQASTIKRIKEGDGVHGCDYKLPSPLSYSIPAQMDGVSSSSVKVDKSNEPSNDKLTSANLGSAERYFFLVDSHPSQRIQSGDESLPWKGARAENKARLPDGSPNLELALGVEKKQSREGLPFFAGIVDRKNPDRPPDIERSKVEDEDASASLSLSLAFPFSEKERPTRLERSSTSAQQSDDGKHEVNSSLLFFRGQSHK